MDSHLLDKSYAMQTRKPSFARKVLKALCLCLWFVAEMTIGLLLMPFVLPFVSKAEREQMGA